MSFSVQLIIYLSGLIIVIYKNYKPNNLLSFSFFYICKYGKPLSSLSLSFKYIFVTKTFVLWMCLFWLNLSDLNIVWKETLAENQLLSYSISERYKSYRMFLFVLRAYFIFDMPILAILLNLLRWDILEFVN